MAIARRNHGATSAYQWGRNLSRRSVGDLYSMCAGANGVRSMVGPSPTEGNLQRIKAFQRDEAQVGPLRQQLLLLFRRIGAERDKAASYACNRNPRGIVGEQPQAFTKPAEIRVVVGAEQTVGLLEAIVYRETAWAG